MASLVISAAGAWAGSALAGAAGYAAGATVALGMTGAQLGWLAGGLVASAFTPEQKVTGPRMGDSTVTGASYGAVIPYYDGHPAVAGHIIWARRNEISTTTSQGGKGGGTKSETFSYTLDALILLTENVIGGVSRIWINGELVYDVRPTADAATVLASLNSDKWDRLAVYTGDASQMPDPLYEEAVGTENAPAYRGRGTLLFEGLKLRGGFVPNFKIEIWRSADLDDLPDGCSVIRYEDLGSGLSFQDITDAPLTVNYHDELSGYSIQSDYVKTFNGLPSANCNSEMNFPRPTSSISHGARFHLADIDMDPFVDGDWTITVPIWLDSAKPNLAGGWVFNYGGLGWAFSTPYNRSSYNTGMLSCFVQPNGEIFVYFGRSANTIGADVQVLEADPDAHFTKAHLDQWCWITIEQSAGARAFYIDGWLAKTEPKTVAMNNDSPASFFIAAVFSQGHPVGDTVGGFVGNIARFDICNFAKHNGQNFTVSETGSELPQTVDPLDETVQGAVTRLCQRAGLSSGQFDATALSAITTPLRGMLLTQVSTVRAALEILAGAYFFDAVLRGDQIVFVVRGGASVATLAYDDIGWSTDGSGVSDPMVITHGNELEAPSQIAVTFLANDADYEPDTQYSHRLALTQTNTSVLSMPLALTAAEGKSIAERALFDAAWLFSTSIGVSIENTRLEPTDVITLTDVDGETHRVRITERSESAGVIQLACVYDDASVSTQSGVTSGNAHTGGTVAAAVTTILDIVDGPLLRDSYDRPGVMLAASGATVGWLGGTAYWSRDNVDYQPLASLENATVLGAATNVLGAWNGVDAFDESTTVSVRVYYGELTSITRAAALADPLLNVAMIGDELVQFLTATLLETGYYKLSRLLRGRKGTGWATSTHAIGDRFALMQESSLKFVGVDNADLGSDLYVKAVSAGQLLSISRAIPVTPMGVSQMPIAPAGARVNREASDHVITWRRGTRLSSRLVGPLGINAPLGETVESYEVDIFADAGDATAGTDVLRTLTSSSESVTYSAADRTTDSTGSTVIYMRIYQLSETLGRGYPLITSR